MHFYTNCFTMQLSGNRLNVSRGTSDDELQKKKKKKKKKTA